MLQYEVKAKCLARKVKKWFDETQGKQGDIQYRFTGKESRLFCHNFMRLIKHLSHEEDSQKQKQTVLVLSYVGLKLRDCCSIFNRFEVQESVLVLLASLAKDYYRANALFLPTSVNPRIWTLGHVLPVHARYAYDTYKQGLMTVTMEGREAKHIALHRLSGNTTYQNRWQEIFRHEFIMLIWQDPSTPQKCNVSKNIRPHLPRKTLRSKSKNPFIPQNRQVPKRKTPSIPKKVKVSKPKSPSIPQNIKFQSPRPPTPQNRKVPKRKAPSIPQKYNVPKPKTPLHPDKVKVPKCNAPSTPKKEEIEITTQPRLQKVNTVRKSNTPLSSK